MVAKFNEVVEGFKAILAEGNLSGLVIHPQLCILGCRSMQSTRGKLALIGTLVPGLEEIMPIRSAECNAAPMILQFCQGDQPKVVINGESFEWTEEGRRKAHDTFKDLEWNGPHGSQEVDANVSEGECDNEGDCPNGDRGKGESGDIGEEFDNSESDGSSEANENDEPIVVLIMHPEISDFRIIDLSGLLGHFKEYEEAEKMICQYIEPLTCLIVVIKSYHSLEAESAAALALKVDPSRQRTFEVFDKTPQDSIMNDKCDAATKWFLSNGTREGLRPIELGQKGHEKLFLLLSKITRHYISPLQSKISAEAAKAVRRIRILGLVPQSKDDIHSDLLSYVRSYEHGLERGLADQLYLLRTELEGYKANVRAEWVSEHCSFNNWDPLVFQGKKAITSCIQRIVADWWTMPINEAVEEALSILEDHIMVMDQFACRTDELARYFRKLSNPQLYDIAECLRTKVGELLAEVMEYRIPDYCLNKFYVEPVSRILTELRKQIHERSFNGLTGPGARDEILKLIDDINKSHKQKGRQDVIEQQEKCVFSTLQSYYFVLLDQIANRLLTLFNESILNKWRTFVYDILPMDHDLLNFCDESLERISERQELIAVKERMLKCDQKLDQLVHIISQY